MIGPKTTTLENVRRIAFILKQSDLATACTHTRHTFWFSTLQPVRDPTDISLASARVVVASGPSDLRLSFVRDPPPLKSSMQLRDNLRDSFM